MCACSLYANSLQQHPVCVLLKCSLSLPSESEQTAPAVFRGDVSIEGKSTDQTFVANIVEEIRGLLADSAALFRP